MSLRKKFTATVKSLAKHIVMTAQLFSKNGLANHAAAGAYGFLLSAAPMLLLVSFFLFMAFRSSPQPIIELLQNIPFLQIVFDEHWLSHDFFKSSLPGISGIISLFSVFWASSILAGSLYRGLNVIFPGTKKRNPVFNNVLILAIQALVLLVSLIIILGSSSALHLYGAFKSEAVKFNHAIPILTFLGAQFHYRFFRFVIVSVVLCIAYRMIPANPPRRFSALKGSVFCAFAFECTVAALGILLRQQMYNFIYGALGGLIMLLINVFFFFLFFFMGAQLAFVIDSLKKKKK